MRYTIGMNEDNNTPSNEQKPRKRMLKKVILTLVVILLLGAAGAYIFIQSQSLSKVNSTNNDLSGQVSKLTASNKELTDQNTSLKKSIEALADPQTSSEATSNPSVKGELTINKVQIVTPSYYGNTGTNADTDQLRAIFFTMKNTSAESKQFTILDFTATTDKGEIVKPLIYAGPMSGNFWNNSTLAAGGSTEQSITFDSKYNLVTLQWAPSGFDVTSLAIPATTN
jgi:cytoskeletal protein RodZ